MRNDDSSSCRLRALLLLQRLPSPTEATTGAVLSRVGDDSREVQGALYRWLVTSPIAQHDALKVNQRVELVMHSLRSSADDVELYNRGVELVRRWARELGQRNQSKCNIDALAVIRALGAAHGAAANRIAAALLPSLREVDALPKFHTPPYERAELVMWRAVASDAAARFDAKQLALELTRIRLTMNVLVGSLASKSVRSLDAHDLNNFLSLVV